MTTKKWIVRSEASSSFVVYVYDVEAASAQEAIAAAKSIISNDLTRMQRITHSGDWDAIEDNDE